MPVWHPLLRLVLQRPDLMVEHASAYAALAADEGSAALGRVLRQRAWQLLAALCLAIALVLAGVSLLLWAALPVVAVGLRWVMFAVPAVPLLAAVAAWLAARPATTGPAFAGLMAQAEIDRAAWREFRAGALKP
jgi:hypothetical protein